MAYVLETRILQIKTNKGVLKMPLALISEDIVVGKGFFVKGMDADGNIPWRPFKDPVSCLAVHSTPFRHTEFVSNDGRISGTSNGDNKYTITIKDTSGKLIENKTYILNNDEVLAPGFTLLIGTNGNAWLSDDFTKSTASKWDADSYVIPSDYGFGELTKTTFNGVVSTSPVKQSTIDFANAIISLGSYEQITDPYDKGGGSATGGGDGTFGGGNTIFGGASDSINIPPLPTASASAAGFITLFNPTLGQLNNLANYMWSDLFSLDTFKKIFSDPMDCILGLSIVPVKPASAGTSAVKIGNVSTDVSMNKTSSQYVAVDCGTIEVKEYWGAYLDYAPYTQCEIYLPYVGTKQISVDDVMNKAVHVVYHVDILSGACNAYVKCGDSVLYTFVGQCSSSIPISGNDWTNVLNGAISVAGKIGLAMATGGATALMSGLGAASSIISSSKPTVERSGAMSSTGGLLGIQKPYLILTRPKQALPENQNKYTGYPSFITMTLSDCTGYTEIDSLHLENMSCTDEEAQEIENLLKSGVIF